MKNVLYYYTGTGNSLWVARQLAKRIKGDTVLVSLRGDYEMPEADCDCLGIVFPVHVWGVPRRVVDFVNKLSPLPGCYTFAAAVNAGQVAATLLQLRDGLRKRNVSLDAGFEFALPSNYIIWNGAEAKTKQNGRFKKALPKFDWAADFINSRYEGPIEKGPRWQNWILSAINGLTFYKVPGLDKAFWTEEKCNGCGLCAKLCPSGNIRMESDRPVWQHHCEQCLACLQWCSREAIQYGKKTAGRLHYHHPEVSAADMLQVRKSSD